MIQQKHIAQIIKLGGIEKLSIKEINSIYDFRKDGLNLSDLETLLDLETERRLVENNYTYHAGTIRECATGLRDKLKRLEW